MHVCFASLEVEHPSNRECLVLRVPGVQILWCVLRRYVCLNVRVYMPLHMYVNIIIPLTFAQQGVKQSCCLSVCPWTKNY